MRDEAKKKCDILLEPKVFGTKCLKIVDAAYYHSICMYDMCIRKNAKDTTPLCRAAAALAHAALNLDLIMMLISVTQWHSSLAEVCFQNIDIDI